MTCMKQEFCIHKKYCQRHIGQNFDSCILFSRNSKPMTNEEWIKSANTEQLAEFLMRKARFFELAQLRLNSVEFVIEWLKGVHKE